MAPETVPPQSRPTRWRRVRRRFRLLIRIGVCGAALVLLAALVIFYGWRYGFTPLPDPAPGVRLEPVSHVWWSAVSTNNAWYWAREANGGAATEQAAPPVIALSAMWTLFGLAALTNREALAEYFADGPQLERYLEAALGCAPSNERWDYAGRLRSYPLWLAAEAEARRDGRAAFTHLSAAMQLDARLFGGPRGMSGAAGRLAAAWRRLALAGPPVTPADARALIQMIVPPTNALASVEAAMRYEGGISLEIARADWHLQRGVDRAYIKEEFKQALSTIFAEAKAFFPWLVARFLPGGDTKPLEMEGARHLWPPLVELWNELSLRAARSGDFERIARAYCTQVLSRLEAGRLEDAMATADTLRRLGEERGWLRRWVDRPAVWAWMAEATYPEVSLTGWKNQTVVSESCRLVLALRCYREAHQVWPERLEQLVPEFLTAVPVDPFSGEPFGYHRGTNWWVLWSIGLTGQKPQLDAPPANPAPPGTSGNETVFYSAEAEKAQVWWERMQTTQRLRNLRGPGGARSLIMDPQMLWRYGLLPSLPSGSFPQGPGFTPTSNQPPSAPVPPSPSSK